MSNFLSPETNLALLSASQSDTKGAADKIKKMRQMEKIESASQDFEAMFISEMMKPMFEGIKTDGMFGGGKGEEIFNGLLLQEYGKIMAQTGTIGVADQVKEAMIQMQAEQQSQSILKGALNDDTGTDN